jgi:hypothetical protein
MQLKAVPISANPSIIDAKVSILYPAQPLRGVLKYNDATFGFRITLGIHHKQPDPTYSLWLLRAGSGGPGRCQTAEKANELAPPHARFPGFAALWSN